MDQEFLDGRNQLQCIGMVGQSHHLGSVSGYQTHETGIQRHVLGGRDTGPVKLVVFVAALRIRMRIGFVAVAVAAAVAAAAFTGPHHDDRKQSIGGFLVLSRNHPFDAPRDLDLDANLRQDGVLVCVFVVSEERRFQAFRVFLCDEIVPGIESGFDNEQSDLCRLDAGRTTIHRRVQCLASIDGVLVVLVRCAVRCGVELARARANARANANARSRSHQVGKALVVVPAGPDVVFRQRQIGGADRLLVQTRFGRREASLQDAPGFTIGMLGCVCPVGIVGADPLKDLRIDDSSRIPASPKYISIQQGIPVSQQLLFHEFQCLFAKFRIAIAFGFSSTGSVKGNGQESPQSGLPRVPANVGFQIHGSCSVVRGEALVVGECECECECVCACVCVCVLQLKIMVIAIPVT
mmetsp:Transcript_8847/g.21619  ORF Transcript_8847/g.21619 Transcript_8847/m.21619 type:complete len:408 (+) Transcript_8847:1376-2599(+)